MASLAGVLAELKRVYRMAHRDEMSWQDASAAARVLREVRACIEGDEIEQRLVRLEAAVEARDRDRQAHKANGGRTDAWVHR